MERTAVVSGVLVLLASLVSCSSASKPQAAPNEEYQYSTGNKALRTEAEVAAALQAAETAFLAAKWGEAVVNANKVMEGVASAEQYYSAVKILGMASCNRKDLRPITHAYSRLGPDDKEGLRRECALNGLIVSKTGSVTPADRK